MGLTNQSLDPSHVSEARKDYNVAYQTKTKEGPTYRRAWVGGRGYRPGIAPPAWDQTASQRCQLDHPDSPAGPVGETSASI